MSREIRFLKLLFAVLLTSLSLVFAISLFWNMYHENKLAYDYAKVEAYASYNKDLLFRRWATMHGGVYVPITDSTPPNPNLDFLPERNILTQAGKQLTLMNPAYIIRQVHEIAQGQYGVKGHITSLIPIRPENKPDQWEKKALELFDKGVKEYSTTEVYENKSYLRFMMPIYTEQACLKCHEQQGYQLGEIRGGISVAVPMDPYLQLAQSKIKEIIIFHLLIYLVLLIAGTLGFRKYMFEVKKRYKLHYKLLESEANLKKQNLEYVTLNEKLINAKEKAEESDRLKTAFLHNISHEIRTPMNSIIGFTELLGRNLKGNPKFDTFISIIQNSSHQLLSIVTDILTISSIEANQVIISNQSFSANVVLRQLFDVFDIQGCQKNISLRLKMPLNDNQSMLFSDKAKFTQILTNLLSNAIKFTHDGFIEFGYKIKNNLLLFYVKDTGIGIEEHLLGRIFERFLQADDSINRNYGGNGLGLSIAKAMVELLGGNLQVISEFKKGSEFYFELPLTKINEPVKAIPAINKTDNKFTILVVDDVYNNVRLIEEIFKDSNYNVIQARNGNEAIKICRNNTQISIILMDIRMPIMDGIEATKIIHNEFPKLPIIAQTAYSISTDKSEYLAQGFIDYIAKPIDKDEIKQKVEQCFISH